MYVLGIDTATPVAAVAVTAGDNLLAERVVNNRKTHSVNLLPVIESVLSDAEIGPGDLEGIAVSSGPGSFTGLRIGMSTAKTLAHVLKIPVTGISTLEALAFRFSACPQIVCPVLNARKNEVYAAVYREGECLQEDMAVDVKSLAGILYKFGDSVLMPGDGAAAYREQILEHLGPRAVFVPGSSCLPGGSEIAYLGYLRVKAGDYSDAFHLLPRYIRLSEAEVKWLKKYGSEGNRA